ncbi:MAG: cupin domain-containing protein [Verrucomicrobiae bacterium]|nr:cupin domain-containing protein [Verrucomicrobiae bacterium]
METAEYWIEHLRLVPHPEGGFFRETYRCEEQIAAGLPRRYTSPRSFSTAIYFLLRSQDVSTLHRLQSDEIWHFYHGSPLSLHLLTPDGRHLTQHLGRDPAQGQRLQAVIKAGCWFGATVNAPQAFTLLGCTVAPGFDFADFELGQGSELILLFPQHRQIIERLTRK